MSVVVIGRPQKPQQPVTPSQPTGGSGSVLKKFTYVAPTSSSTSTSTSTSTTTTADYTPAKPEWNSAGLQRAAAGKVQAKNTMQKRNIGIFGLLLLGAMAFAQTDNTFSVRAFPGLTVGQKLTAAMASCNPSASVPCVLVIDPSLATWPTGTMPGLCAQCNLIDYRQGVPWSAIAALPASYTTAKCLGVDDTSTVQAAVTAAAAVDSKQTGAVLIPAGTSCALSSTVTIPGNVMVIGTEPKRFAEYGGSGITYSGTGDAFLIQAAGGPTAYTYVVGFKNLNFKALGAATSFIRFHGINGPSMVENCNFDGEWIASHGVVYDTPQAGLQSALYNNFFSAFTGWEVQNFGMSNFVANLNQFFASNVGGLYMSDPESAEVADNYFELMPVGMKVGNDLVQVNIRLSVHDNLFRNFFAPPIGAPVNTSVQRCMVVASTDNTLPMFGSISIRDNECNMSPNSSGVRVQGAGLYGYEFSTASNTSTVNLSVTMEGNETFGPATAAIYNDNANVEITHRLNRAWTIWTTGVPTPVALTMFAGSGSFASMVKDVSTIVQGSYTGTAGTGYLTGLTAARNPGGTYRGCWYFQVSVAGTAGNFTGFFSYTSNGQVLGDASTSQVPTTPQWGHTYGQTCQLFHADANTVIQYNLVGTSVTGTPTVKYDVSIERLNP